MRIFKKKQFNLLAVTITTLLLALTCGLTACGSKSSDPAVSSAENSSAENSGPGEAAETGSAGIPVNPELEAAALEGIAEITMEDAQAKLICKNERWIAIAYYGPEDVRLSPCWNGTVDAWPFGQYGRDLSSGWTVAYMVRRPERGDSLFSQEELDGLGLYTDITFTVDLYFRSSDSNKEQNETMIQKLKESEPYMIYTGLDGETVKTSLSWE